MKFVVVVPRAGWRLGRAWKTSSLQYALMMEARSRAHEINFAPPTESSGASGTAAAIYVEPVGIRPQQFSDLPFIEVTIEERLAM